MVMKMMSPTRSPMALLGQFQTVESTWINGDGRKLDSSGYPFIDKQFVNQYNRLYHGCPKVMEMPVWARRKVCFELYCK